MQGVAFSYMDFIVIGIIAVFALIGIKRGFVRSIVGIISLGASILLAWLLYPVVSDLFKTIGVGTAIHEKILDVLTDCIGVSGEGMALPIFMKDAIESGRQELILEATNTATDMVLNIISFIAVLILSRIIIFIAQKLLIVLSELPLIGFFNKLAGLAFGAIQGLLIVFIVFTIIYATVPLNEDSGIGEAIENSVIAGKLYEANPLVKIFVDDGKTDGDGKEELRTESDYGKATQ